MRTYSLESTKEMLDILWKRHSIQPVMYTIAEGGDWYNWMNRDIIGDGGSDIHSLILTDLHKAWVWDNVNGFRDKGPMYDLRMTHGREHNLRFEDITWRCTDAAGPLKSGVLYTCNYFWEEKPGTSHGGSISLWDVYEDDTGLPVILDPFMGTALEQDVHIHALERYMENISDD